MSYWTSHRRIRAAVAREIENINTQNTASAVLHSSPSDTANNEEQEQGSHFEDVVSGPVTISLNDEECVNEGNMEIGGPSEESAVNGSERILEGDMFNNEDELNVLFLIFKGGQLQR